MLKLLVANVVVKYCLLKLEKFCYERCLAINSIYIAFKEGRSSSLLGSTRFSAMDFPLSRTTALAADFLCWVCTTIQKSALHTPLACLELFVAGVRLYHQRISGENSRQSRLINTLRHPYRLALLLLA